MPKTTPTNQVVIAVDPHKASWTAVAVDQQCRPLDSLRVEVNRTGCRQLRRFARAWPHAIWAIEGARGLGAPPGAEAGHRRYPNPRCSRETRPPGQNSLDRTRPQNLRGRRPVGRIAALNSTGLQSMRTDTTAQVLRTLTEYRGDLIRTRTQTANRLHRLLVQLVPAGLPERLTAEAAA